MEWRIWRPPIAAARVAAQAAGEDDAQVAWAREFGEGIQPYSTRGGGYLNYMARDEPLERVEAAFGAEKFARLRELKRAYDPGQPVPPEPEHPAG